MCSQADLHGMSFAPPDLRPQPCAPPPMHCFVRLDRPVGLPPRCFDLTEGNCDGKSERPTDYDTLHETDIATDARHGVGKERISTHALPATT